jgi:hypothetical protein
VVVVKFAARFKKGKQDKFFALGVDSSVNDRSEKSRLTRDHGKPSPYRLCFILTTIAIVMLADFREEHKHVASILFYLHKVS